jgi:hypothetical protein
LSGGLPDRLQERDMSWKRHSVARDGRRSLVGLAHNLEAKTAVGNIKAA